MAIVLSCKPTSNYSHSTITSRYGGRTLNGKKGFHYGIDLAPRQRRVDGDPIYAAQGGVVKRVTYDAGGYGAYIVIEHQRYGFCSLYGHLSAQLVSEGEFVNPGQQIGKMGSTGRSTGTHLHFELRNVRYSQFNSVRHNKAYVVDPQPYLDKSSVGFSTNEEGQNGYSPIVYNSPFSDGFDYTYEKVIIKKNSLSKTGNMLFGRKYRIMVFNKTNKGYDVSDLHVTFDISKSLTMDNTSGMVRIYNLNIVTENDLIMNCNRVTIEAGYEGLYGLIYDGDVIQGIRGVENGTDEYLDLICMDGDRFLNSGFTSYSIAKGASKRDAAKAICNTATNAAQIDDISTAFTKSKYIRGKVIFGKAKDYLSQMASSENANFYIDNGKVKLTSVTDLPKNSILSLDSSSGLIGSPQQTSEGITFQCLLNPRIKLNSLVHISNEQIIEQRYSDGNSIAYTLDSENLYRIIKIEFSGDTRGSNWYINCTGVSQAGAIPALVADIIGQTGAGLSDGSTYSSDYDDASGSVSYGTSGAKSFKSFMYYQSLTSKSSKQYKLQKRCTTDGNGLRRFRESLISYYVIAMGSYYGYTGQKLKITLTSGKEFYAIIGDTKADSETDALHKYHLHDGSEIEFIVDRKTFKKKNPKVIKTGDCSYLGFKGKISRCSKLGIINL